MGQEALGARGSGDRPGSVSRSLGGGLAPLTVADFSHQICGGRQPSQALLTRVNG